MKDKIFSVSNLHIYFFSIVLKIIIAFIIIFTISKKNTEQKIYILNLISEYILKKLNLNKSLRLISYF